MPIRTESIPPRPLIVFLKHCYRFVSLEWQHIVRDQSPDQGFEKRFRESCIVHLNDWSISQEREMRLGAGLETFSGVLHEIDLVARGQSVTAILELKNRSAKLTDKNDVIIFFAKIMDYLTKNPELVSEELCLSMVSSRSLEDRGLAACLGLGIHPVTPEIRPLPLLVSNAGIMKTSLSDGVKISSDQRDRFEDLCAQLNNLSSALSESWLDSRCGYVSNDSIVIRSVEPLPVDSLAQQLRQANSDCTELLQGFKKARDL